MFCCPVCGRPLRQEEKAYRCPARHTYDIAAQGYVNLLLPQKKSSADPGDNAEMVQARTRFLSCGAYRPLSDRVNRLILENTGPAPALLDLGCGEGYYTARLREAMKAAEREASIYGIDLSRRALRHAARACPGAHFAVASLYDLPFADGAFTLIYNIFAPIAAAENARVLPPGGLLLAVYPAARHLFELKNILYERPYLNEEGQREIPGFSLVKEEHLCFAFSCESGETLQSLYKMTPYFYRTPAEGAARLQALSRLDLTADFTLALYRRKK
ncbi:MAG: methyltransferase domain-containing protein [Provencibacterium sp.]|nr:methyltransferase domain-containing protein [Provencibacterium sp.]